jgi:hypothetical protein
LTDFPIHILELLTLGLILLSIFRIFKNLSFETANDSFQHALSDFPATQERIGPSIPPRLEFVKPLETKTLKPLYTIDNTDIPQNTIVKSTNTNPTKQHQTVLKNYIGDFF